MSLRFRRRAALTAAGLTVAASVAAAGPASAWVNTSQHSGSGQTVAGQVRITYTNPLDATITCRVKVYPVGKLKTLRQSAYFSNLAAQQTANGKKTAARKSLTRAEDILRSAGRTVYESRTATSVSPGARKIVFVRPSGQPARYYSALSTCGYKNTGAVGPVTVQSDTAAFRAWPVDV